jgi:hypothetical protein
MSKQIQSIAFAALIVPLLLLMAIFFSVGTAEAKECSVAMPSHPKGYWSYRLIDGRKCWYEGKPMLSKASLQWPAQVATRSASISHTTRHVIEAADEFDPDKCCWPALDDSNTFEERWRGVNARMGRD